MKKILLTYSIALILGVLILSSCSEDERPLPMATSEFVVATIAPEVHLPVYFENNSLNAAYYVWDFGDGSEVDSAKSVSISHVYEEPGNYTVKLRAYNEDGAFQETEQTVDVGERFLNGFLVVALGDEDLEGKKFVVDTTRGIDLMMAFGPTADVELGNEGRFLDIPLIMDSVGATNLLPNGFTLNEDYKLTNEDYLLYLFRVDSIKDETIYRTALDAVQFNPLNENITVKNQEGQGGVIYPLIAEFGFQYFLEFEIK